MISNRLLRCALVSASVAVPALGLAPGASADDAPKFVVNKVAEKPLASLPAGDLYWTAETFPTLYDSAVGENEFGRFFRAKNMVDALFLSGGFEILAPWGQGQTADSGYLLFNGEEVYGNNATTFEETYEIVS